MNKIIFILLIAIWPLATFAQTPKQVPGTEGQKTHDEAAINSMPPNFQFIKNDGTYFSNKDLPKNKPMIFALFSPNCDHCQKAVAEMKAKTAMFKDATIVFVTFGTNFKELESFVQTTGVGDLKNFYICAAPDRWITSYFMPNYILPQVIVFNKQQKLKKIFYETINTDSLNFYMNK